MIEAIFALWKNRRIVFFCYFISFLFSLSIGVMFYNTLINASENTLSLNSLVKEFDYLIFSDAIRIYADVLKPYFLWFSIIFLMHQLVYTFLSGGIIDALIYKKLVFPRFLIQSFRYWGKTLGISILLFLLAILCLAIVILLGLAIEKLIQSPDHRSIILMQIPPFFLFILSQMYLFLVWDYTRILFIKYPQLSTFQAFLKGLWLTISHFFPLKTLTALIILSFMGLGIYLLADTLIGMRSALTVIIMFIVQQVFVFYRASLRLLNLEMAQLFIRKKTIQ